jgi:general secretion pathway protein C
MLIGAVTNDRNPELSRVVVRTLGGAAVIAAGGRVGAFVVDAVQTDGALLRDAGGGLCALRGFSRAADEPASEPEEAQIVPRGKPVFSPAELADGLQKLGEDDYLVKKAFLLKALSNPGGSAGGAWFRPAQLDGANTGMEVLGIRAGTALDAMGVRNGDVIRDLNGIALDAAPNLIAALRGVREASNVSVNVLRDGRPQELRFRVE